MLHTSSSTSYNPSLIEVPNAIRALLLDDSNFDRARIRRLSNKTNLSIELDEVASIAELDQVVARENYDLILIDYRLPVGDGLDALNVVLQNDLNRGAGKIMITGDEALETAVKAMRGGCHDFLTKDEMSVDALRTAMLNALQAARRRLEPVTELETQREIIRQGLVDAMQDGEVQGNVLSIVQKHLHAGGERDRQLARMAENADLETLLARFGDEDDFVFH